MCRLQLCFFALCFSLSGSATAQTGNYYKVETARTTEQINAVFPYDIDLKTADGQVINSSKVFSKGEKPTVLVFWLTTCAPCRMELEALKKNYDSWKKETDFNLFAISTDFEHNFPNFVKRATESNWQFLALNDFHREFCKILPGSLNGLPQVFLLDKTGQITYQHRRYVPGDEATLLEEIKKINKKP